MGNELQSYNDTPFNDWGVTQYKLMKTLIQRYDTTRKVTVAMHPRYRNWETDSLPCDLAKVTDIQAYRSRNDSEYGLCEVRMWFMPKSFISFMRFSMARG